MKIRSYKNKDPWEEQMLQHFCSEKKAQVPLDFYPAKE